MINFVLIPGSWHDAAPFDPVVSHLEAKGHRAVALTLAGHGKGTEKKGITHDDCVKTVTDYLVRVTGKKCLVFSQHLVPPLRRPVCQP